MQKLSNQQLNTTDTKQHKHDYNCQHKLIGQRMYCKLFYSKI